MFNLAEIQHGAALVGMEAGRVVTAGTVVPSARLPFN